MADEPKLVTALEVRLNAFEKQLKDAGVIAEREVKNIENTFAKANPVFGGTFLGTFLGNLAKDIPKELVSFVTDLIDRFKELEKTAKLVNVAMQDLFGLQEAAGKFGAKAEDVNTSMRNLASLLAAMQRGEKNSLSALFDANPAALKGINRELLTVSQTWDIVANLVQNTEKNIEKIDVAKAAGQMESLIPLMEKGAAGAASLQKAAADTAPDLQKLANLAKDFDDAWQLAIKNFKAYLLTDALTAMRAFVETVSGWMITVGKGFNAITPERFDKPVVEAIAAWTALNEQMRIAREYAPLADAFGPSSDRTLATRKTGSTVDPNRPKTVVPVTAAPPEERSRLDAAIDRAEKHAKALNAETDAIDKGTAAREQAKIKEELLTVAQQANGKVTEEQRARIDAVAEAYGRAAAKAEQARAPLETFARESANLGKLMNDFAATSLNNVTTELANIVTGSKTAAEAFSALAKSIINDLVKIAIRQAITGPIASAFGGVFQVGGATSKGFNFFGAAEGGTFGAGRWGVVGEKGPELIQTHAGGGVSVYPTKLPGFADGGYLPAPTGGGTTMQGAQITINAPGADKAGLARVEAEVIKLNRSLETRAVRAVSDASSRGHTVIRR